MQPFHPQHQCPARMRRRRSAGFSLVEMLIAMGVFAVGMVAVVSMFPVSAILQRETAKEVVGQNAARSARAVVAAKQLTFGAPGSSFAGSGDLDSYHSLAGETKTNAIPLSYISPALLTINGGVFTPQDRAFPTSQVVDNFDVRYCDMFWVPFIQDVAGDDSGIGQIWVMRVFLLQRDSRVEYPLSAASDTNVANPRDSIFIPKVVKTTCNLTDESTFNLGTGAHGLRAGDVIMDNNGIDHVISQVNGSNVTVVGRIPTTPAQPKTVWYAPPNGSTRSPAVRIETITLSYKDGQVVLLQDP